MATFTIIQINNDHIENCDEAALGAVVKILARNPSNEWHCRDERFDIMRAVHVIGQTGNPLRADDIQQYWLAKGQGE